MYRLLIVDDEEIIRNGLKNNIRWSEIGFEEPLLAENGRQALDLVAGFHPHVVLTDIRMPVMDGLELLKAVKHQYPGIRSVIMSGYNDFEYARKGMEYGARTYILKPTSSQEILEIFASLRDEIAAQEQEMAALTQLADNSSKYLRIERYNSLRQILESRIREPDAVAEAIRKYGLSLVPPHAVCLLFRMDSLCSPESDESSALQTEIRSTIDSLEPCRDWSCEFCRIDSEKTALLVTSRDLLSVRDLRIFTEALKSRLAARGDLDFLCGISDSHGLDGIGTAYMEAGAGLRTCFFKGRNSTSFRSDTMVRQASPEFQQRLDRLEAEILEATVRNDTGRLKSLLMDFFSEIRNHAPEIEWIIERCLKLAVSVRRRMLESGSAGEDLVADVAYKDLGSCFVLDDLKRRIEEHCLRIAQLLAKGSEKDAFVRKVTDYLKENYANKIKLEDVAAIVFMNPSYFSVLFKEKTGQNFSDLLNEFRIEKAKKLLESHDFKIADIAELVGFYDTAHFCKAFRKVTGVTPLNYRRRFIIS